MQKAQVEERFGVQSKLEVKKDGKRRRDRVKKWTLLARIQHVSSGQQGLHSRYAQ
jgi:hypothetical protein